MMLLTENWESIEESTGLYYWYYINKVSNNLDTGLYCCYYTNKQKGPLHPTQDTTNQIRHKPQPIVVIGNI